MAKQEKRAWKWWAIGIGLVAIGIFNRKTIMTKVWDIYTEERIKKLHPAIRNRARMFINTAQEKYGIKLRITSGHRDFFTQEELYSRPWDGIDNDKDGLIDEADEKVTQAKPGSSFHNYGLALDVVEIKDGKGLWENPNWPLIGRIGKSFGFEWGGDWIGFVDRPHFEYPPGIKVSELLAQYNAGNKDVNGYLTMIV